MARYVEVGGNLIGLRPLRSQGIVSAGDEREFQTLALRLWQSCEADPSHAAAVGKGHLYCTPDAHNAFVQMRVLPDFEGQASTAPLLDYVHRTTPDAEIYFLRNTTPQPIVTSVVLRMRTPASRRSFMRTPARSTLTFSFHPPPTVGLVYV